MYKFTPTTLAETKYLSIISGLLTSDRIELYHQASDDPSRIGFDGMITLTGQIHGRTVGLVVSDFRVAGGSFSKKNSTRTGEFIRHMGKMKIPLVFVINSLGVRFMEGRTVFDDAFSIISDLYSYRQENMLITVGLGKALGIGALFFAQGHYRIALENETQLNLTGPEVHKKFFGKVDADFAQFTLADHQFQVNSLIHEVLPSSEMIYRSVQDLIGFVSSKESSRPQALSKVFSNETETGAQILRSQESEKLKELELQMGDEVLELFPQLSPIARIYIGKFLGAPVGYLINPPSHPNNMLTVKAVDKCLAAMDLFKALKLPVVTILDCPGGDPRKAESDKDAIMKMIELAHSMISYPFNKMGVINGRCFGGSAMFAFPKIFGGKQVLAVKGSQVGVMHRQIIEELLSGAPRLKESWQQVAASEVPTLDDLVQMGTIDRVIEREELGREIHRFVRLGGLGLQRPSQENQDSSDRKEAVNE
jgi:acetyl-CoA carboxylase carboxyltransferase component